MARGGRAGVAWPGFEDDHRRVNHASYFVTQGGAGPPVLLLHGFPQTHHCWHRVAPALASTHRVVAPDLKGLGASTAPAGGVRGEGYTKREVAGEMVQLMRELGHEQFAVVGHDRGARVAEYRRAMTPDTIAAVCADYRASYYHDREHDTVDRQAGRRITVPLLAVTGQAETQLAFAPEVWRSWASDLETAVVPGGHFLPEEAPDALIELLLAFLQPGRG